MSHSPLVWDEYGHRVVRLSPLRTRRLLQMAEQPGFNHKAFYGQYCRLMEEGWAGWVIGMAYLTPDGQQHLASLLQEGI